MKTSEVFHTPEAKSAVLQYYDMLLAHAGGALERLYVNTRLGDTFVLATGTHLLVKKSYAYLGSTQQEKKSKESMTYSQNHGIIEQGKSNKTSKTLAQGAGYVQEKRRPNQYR